MTKTPKILNAHAKKRAEERYGVNLNKHTRREIVSKIQSNQAKFVAKHSNNRTLWKVPHGEETLNVVYDKKRQTVCTVLPKDAVEFQPGGTEVQCSVKSEDARTQITNELKTLWGEEK